MRIEDNMRVINLIDAYGALLTSKQFDIMQSYYFDNLSLSEIGDNYGISRQAISDAINQSIKALENYEDKLHDIHKYDTIIDELTSIKETCGSSDLSNRISKIITTLRG